MFPDMFQIFNEEKQREGTVQSQPTAAVPFGNVFVLSVGGSILCDGKPNVMAIAKFSECLNDLIRQGFHFVVVVGGGKVAREYISAAKTLGASFFQQDLLGIDITRANAALLAGSIENAEQRILTDVLEAAAVLERGKTPVFGGLLPGLTTDAVAALIAEFLHATFVNLSNVDGVYSADPATNPHAKFYPELSYDRLLSIVKLSAMQPGQNLVVDLPAAMILRRSRIPAFFLDGKDLGNFVAAIKGQEFRGTVVRESVEGERIPVESVEAEEDEEESQQRRKVARRKRSMADKKRQILEDEDDEIRPEEIDI